jgi:hypothetical protein
MQGIPSSVPRVCGLDKYLYNNQIAEAIHLEKRAWTVISILFDHVVWAAHSLENPKHVTNIERRDSGLIFLRCCASNDLPDVITCSKFSLDQKSSI